MKHQVLAMSVIYVKSQEDDITPGRSNKTTLQQLKIYNTMKKTGQIIFIMGAIISVLAGFELITREKIIDIGGIEIIQQKTQVFNWSPLLGLSVLAVGAGIYLFSRKKAGAYTFNK
jgi:LPXTG-motif cell wall-anchored protein